MRGSLQFHASLVCALTLASSGCDGGGTDGSAAAGAQDGPVDLEATREERAIAGVSMGAYGAMNLGTKHPERFGVIGSLGGPVDMRELLRHLVLDNLEVKAQTGIPRAVGEDFTFDHLPPYPDRDTRVQQFRDLTLALGNPFLHHPDADALYLASDSQPAAVGQDDAFGEFAVPADPQGFLDGGDANEDGLRQLDETPDTATDVLLLAGGTLAVVDPDAGEGTLVGERALVDLDGDGVFDVGDGIVVNLSEPFEDADGDLVFEPDAGETFTDAGLDGVPGTGDLGEGNGAFDYDPDRATWLAQDPLTRLEGRPADEIRSQRFYMDVGTEDAFELGAHYDNLVAVLQDEGIDVVVEEGFSGSCDDVPEPEAQFLLVRYPGGHVGIPDVDSITADLLDGDICGPTLVWQRLLSLLGFLDASFPDGVEGVGGVRPIGDVSTESIPSPALTPAGQDTLTREVVVYRPPAFFNTDETLPVVYFLPGYGQDPDDYERVGNLLDLLIAAGEVQNMYFVVLPGAGGEKGSFYVDHVVPHEQAPRADATTGRYETSILEDLMPAVENEVLEGRIRR